MRRATEGNAREKRPKIEFLALPMTNLEDQEVSSSHGLNHSNENRRNVNDAKNTQIIINSIVRIYINLYYNSDKIPVNVLI